MVAAASRRIRNKVVIDAELGLRSRRLGGNLWVVESRMHHTGPVHNDWELAADTEHAIASHILVLAVDGLG